LETEEGVLLDDALTVTIEADCGRCCCFDAEELELEYDPFRLMTLGAGVGLVVSFIPLVLQLPDDLLLI
jgi:hypothetical protein